MYSSIRIRGYRGLESFELTELGRINLLVGGNNSGKTSILECIELLRSAGNPAVLQSIVSRRGEWGYDGGEERRPLLAVRHLFAGHDFGRKIAIESDGKAAHDVWASRMTIATEDADVEGQADLGPFEEEAPFQLRLRCSNPVGDVKIRMSPEGLVDPRRLRPQRFDDEVVSFVSAVGMSVPEVVRTFDRVVLTDKEESVTEALRAIEPRVERLASVSHEHGLGRAPYRGARGGMYLKLRDVPERVPIGTVGEGMWRVLGLALALANAQGGVLLVDEIDTGLHYSVLDGMWRMVSERAEALSVQVFATTHSSDCYRSLAVVAAPDSGCSGDVTIQRVDPRHRKAARFGSAEVVAAAERGLEVR